MTLADWIIVSAVSIIISVGSIFLYHKITLRRLKRRYSKDKDYGRRGNPQGTRESSYTRRDNTSTIQPSSSSIPYNFKPTRVEQENRFHDFSNKNDSYKHKGTNNALERFKRIGKK